MTDPVRKRVQCASPSGLHWMSYLEWGAADNPRVVVCVHGLTRCGRDFDVLARDLAPHYRVVCPDVAGRGESGWLRNPMEYAVPTYVADMVSLVARLDVESLDWVGTSLGGLIGMAYAAQSDSPIRRMVMNDVGPVLTSAALDRIGAYVGKAPRFSSIGAAENYIRTVSATFGPHSDAQWRSLTEHVVRAEPDGTLRMHYDPAIAVPFGERAPGQDVNLWPLYDLLRCPTLLLRGAESDLLTADTARAMGERGPKARCLEFAGVGHAPTLMHADQIAAVREFLLG